MDSDYLIISYMSEPTSESLDIISIWKEIGIRFYFLLCAGKKDLGK